jgi:NO-binding membrane sensor protein with MHYT domain
MHYVGVSAIRGCGVSFDLYSIAISSLIAIVGATIGLWFAISGRGIAPAAAGGVLLGATVAWVHYTGMYATSFLSDASLAAVSHPYLPQSVLAYAIAMAAVAVCSAQLLMITGAATKLGRSTGIS